MLRGRKQGQGFGHVCGSGLLPPQGGGLSPGGSPAVIPCPRPAGGSRALWLTRGRAPEPGGTAGRRLAGRGVRAALWRRPATPPRKKVGPERETGQTDAWVFLRRCVGEFFMLYWTVLQVECERKSREGEWGRRVAKDQGLSRTLAAGVRLWN